MRVKMKTSMAGADFVWQPGDLVEMSDAQAARFIEAGYAEPVRAELRETATRKPASEKAAK